MYATPTGGHNPRDFKYCYDWANGCCQRGSRCKFAHIGKVGTHPSHFRNLQTSRDRYTEREGCPNTKCYNNEIGSSKWSEEAEVDVHQRKNEQVDVGSNRREKTGVNLENKMNQVLESVQILTNFLAPFQPESEDEGFLSCGASLRRVRESLDKIRLESKEKQSKLEDKIA